MNRKDFFRKSFSKAIAAVEESADEIADAWKHVIQEQKTKEKSPADSPPSLNKKGLTPKQEKIALPQTRLPKRKKFKAFRNLQYPPGVDKTAKRFLSKCTGCGDCIYACPYSVLFPVMDDARGKHLPRMDVNLNACMLCKDYPCIAACETGALLPYKKKKILNSEKRMVGFNTASMQGRGRKLATRARYHVRFRTWSSLSRISRPSHRIA